MSRRKLTEFQQMQLDSPICILWPACACRKNIVHWQEALGDEDRVFTLEELEAAEMVIYFSCACAAEHCPDPAIKAYAARQFANLTRRRERIAQEQLTARAN
jgi:hypothetical protein